MPGYPAVHRTPNSASGTQLSVRPVWLYTRLGFGSTVWFSDRDKPNDPLELVLAAGSLEIISVYRAAGHQDPANLHQTKGCYKRKTTLYNDKNLHQ